MKAVERCFQKELAAETIVSHSILDTRQIQINENPLIPGSLKVKLRGMAAEHLIANHLSNPFTSTVTMSIVDGNQHVNNIMSGKTPKFFPKKILTIEDIPEITDTVFPHLQLNQLGRDPLTKNFPCSILSELISMNLILEEVDIDKNNFFFRESKPKEINGQMTPDLIIQYRDRISGKWKILGIEIKCTEKKSAVQYFYQKKLFSNGDQTIRNIPIIDTSANKTSSTVYDPFSDDKLQGKINTKISNQPLETILIRDKKGNIITQVDLRTSTALKSVKTTRSSLIEDMGITLLREKDSELSQIEKEILQEPSFNPNVNSKKFQPLLDDMDVSKLLDETLNKYKKAYEK